VVAVVALYNALTFCVRFCMVYLGFGFCYGFFSIGLFFSATAAATP